MPSHGWLPVTVPGAPAGWRDLHERFGSLPFESLFADAIAYAERRLSGLATRRGRVAIVRWSRARTLRGPEFDEWRDVFTPGGRAPRAGERLANPAAARTLELIAATGADAFYTGEIARALAAHAAATGGLLTAADLAAHTSTWVDPVSVGLPRARGLGTAAERPGHRRADRARHPRRHGRRRRDPGTARCTGRSRR